MKLHGVVALAAGLAALAVPALAAPSIYTNIKNISLDHAACMARAREVLAQNGVTNISNATWSTFGAYQNHTIVVRCVPDKAFVFIVVAGEVYEVCERLTNTVQAQF